MVTAEVLFGEIIRCIAIENTCVMRVIVLNGVLSLVFAWDK
jgi:hypothetical protein